MTVKTIDCVECGVAVPYGRLSCPACGALLASVSGVRRSPVAVALAPVGSVTAGPVAPAATISPAKTARAPRSTTAARPAPVSAAVAPPEPEISALAPDEPVVPMPVEPPEVSVLAPDEPEVAGPAATAVPAAARAGVPSPGAAPETWRPPADPGPMLEARPYQPHAVPITNMAAPTAQPPGHYRPPTAPPAAVASAALGWVNTDPSVTPSTDPDGPAPSTAATTEPRVVDAARFVEIAGWFVVVGAAMSVLGFMLPWSRAVIGSSGIGGYFDSWGLASPTHVLVVLGLLAVLALGILQTPLPAWLRSGVLGLALGGLVFGLTWPYLVGPLGADVGVLIVAMGGVALMIGGAVASWATRHAEGDPLV